MPSTTPIRIGFIGLSASGGWGSNAHWPYLKQTDKYQIVALCNTSTSSATKAKTHFGLPPSTKCYDSAQTLADDKGVDLVVCSVRVDMHYDLIKPALKAKKPVYCEWPLAANEQEAQELVELVDGPTMIGLQARQAPIVLKIKELVDSGRIGRVLSSTVVAQAGNFGSSEPVRMKYFTDRKVGGNMMSIHFGHTIDMVCFTLGEIKDLSARLSIQRPQIDITKDGEKIETVTKDTADQIMVHGEFESGGVLSVHMRGGQPFKGSPGLTWRVYGDKGEVFITASGPFLQVGYPDMAVKVHDHGSDDVEDISWEGDNDELPMPARNVGRMYEAYAEGKSFPAFDVALTRHKLLEAVYESSGTHAATSYI